MAKRIRKAWAKTFSRRSLMAPNKQALSEQNSRLRSFNEAALASRAKHERRLDKILQDTFGIDRYQLSQPKQEPHTEVDPWIQVQGRINRLAEDLANPKMFTICLSNTTNIKVYLIWGHGGSLVAHQYYVYEYNARVRRLRQSYQFGTRERATEAWRYDRVLWKDTLYLPATS